MTTASQASQSGGNSPELLTFGLESLLNFQKNILLDFSPFSWAGSKKQFWKIRRKPLISIKRYLQYETSGIVECQIFWKDKSYLHSLTDFYIPCVSFLPLIDCEFIIFFSLWGQTGRLVWKFWQIYFKWSDYIKQHGGEKCTGVWRQLGIRTGKSHVQ